MEYTEFVFFWGGPFSQWAHSPFVIDGQRYVTAEQWMMWNKAVMFGDEYHADVIMATDDPSAQKRAGKLVSNFDDDKWMKRAYDIVVEGNRAKFIQLPTFNEALEQTRGKLLVEASPYDRRWGIGLGEGAKGIEDPKNWRGENLLGKAITQVRVELFGD